MDDSYEPIVCTLGRAHAAHRGMELTDLKGLALTAERIDGGAAMTFAVDLADSLEDLAAREALCCGWLSITTTRARREVRLKMTSDNPGAHAMIESLAGIGEQ